MGASAVLIEAMDDLAASDLGVDALYKPVSGSAFPIRVIRRNDPDPRGLGQIGSRVDGVTINVLSSEVPAPVKDDKISFNMATTWTGDDFATVRGALSDKSGLFWSLNLNKAL